MISKETRPTVICLSPVKNEAWILDRFLRCASLWADHIIIADQGSDDGSREIARRFPKVILIDNPSPTYSERERQQLLLAAARRFPEPRFIVALDADEALTANALTSPEWRNVLQSPNGTVVCFRWVNLRPGMQTGWSPDYDHPFGFMDDGTEHSGSMLHSARVPTPPNAPIMRLRDVKVLHYQYVRWDRMESKHRWYQCLERLNQPTRSAIEIYRQYHHMYSVPAHELFPISADWFSGYEGQGIDMTATVEESSYWWDRDVLAMFAEHSPKSFRREAIWDADWSAISKNLLNAPGGQFNDPRSAFDKCVHRWLRLTQPIHNWKVVRFVDRVLTAFWL